MTTIHYQAARFYFFIIGQIILTVGGYGLLFASAIPLWLSFVAIMLGATLIGIGGPSLAEQMRLRFPLRLRISLFLLALAILGAAVLIGR